MDRITSEFKIGQLEPGMFWSRNCESLEEAQRQSIKLQAMVPALCGFLVDEDGMWEPSIPFRLKN